jgi:uncharacterized membrane protein affecting hemolysin expression
MRGPENLHIHEEITHSNQVMAHLVLTLDVTSLLAPKLRSIYRLELLLIGLLVTVSIVGALIQERLVLWPVTTWVSP